MTILSKMNEIQTAVLAFRIIAVKELDNRNIETRSLERLSVHNKLQATYQKSANFVGSMTKD
jgi:hypothetical protein